METVLIIGFWLTIVWLLARYWKLQKKLDQMTLDKVNEQSRGDSYKIEAQELTALIARMKLAARKQRQAAAKKIRDAQKSTRKNKTVRKINIEGGVTQEIILPETQARPVKRKRKALAEAQG